MVRPSCSQLAAVCASDRTGRRGRADPRGEERAGDSGAARPCGGGEAGETGAAPARGDGGGGETGAARACGDGEAGETRAAPACGAGGASETVTAPASCESPDIGVFLQAGVVWVSRGARQGVAGVVWVSCGARQGVAGWSGFHAAPDRGRRGWSGFHAKLEGDRRGWSGFHRGSDKGQGRRELGSGCDEETGTCSGRRFSECLACGETHHNGSGGGPRCARRRRARLFPRRSVPRIASVRAETPWMRRMRARPRVSR